MSREIEQGKTQELRQDSLIAQLVPDPSELPQLRTKFGFLGKSTRNGYWRLYSGLEMNDFLEIRERDIVHSQSLESEDNRLGGTMLWLAQDAVVHRTHAEHQAAQADFLQGSIAEEFLRTTGANSLAAGGPYGLWTIFTSAPCAVATIVIVIYSAVKCKK